MSVLKILHVWLASIVLMSFTPERIKIDCVGVGESHESINNCWFN